MAESLAKFSYIFRTTHNTHILQEGLIQSVSVENVSLDEEGEEKFRKSEQDDFSLFKSDQFEEKQ